MGFPLEGGFDDGFEHSGNVRLAGLRQTTGAAGPAWPGMGDRAIMISPAHAQLVLSALGNLSQIAASRDQLRHEQAIAELRAGALCHVVDALISRRVDVVQDGFLRVLDDYAAQAKHYMAQQDRYAGAELETSDPLRRIELRKRLNDIDIELRQLRVQAERIYNRMTEVVLLIGGTSLNVDDDCARQLALPPLTL
jgi:hypothetical protein